jgi:hypothetical protein
VGIESSSHRQRARARDGRELEVLTGDGRVLVCTPENHTATCSSGFPIRTERSATPSR